MSCCFFPLAFSFVHAVFFPIQADGECPHLFNSFLNMPTYEYACDKCDHRFDYFQSMRDDPLVTCPECNEDALRRVIGAGAGLIFKGSGFYQTDYKNNGSQSGAKGDSAGGESGGKSETSTSVTSAKSESGSGGASPPAEKTNS